MISAHKILGSIAFAALLGAPALADNPPVPNPELVEAMKGLEKARAIRKRVDAGDAAAMYEFGVLLARFGPGSYSPDFEHAKEWVALADGKRPSDWINAAADAGDQTAIEVVCRIGADPLAPARLREKGSARCEELRRKFPGKK